MSFNWNLSAWHIEWNVDEWMAQCVCECLLYVTEWVRRAARRNTNILDLPKKKLLICEMNFKCIKYIIICRSSENELDWNLCTFAIAILPSSVWALHLIQRFVAVTKYRSTIAHSSIEKHLIFHLYVRVHCQLIEYTNDLFKIRRSYSYSFCSQMGWTSRLRLNYVFPSALIVCCGAMNRITWFNCVYFPAQTENRYIHITEACRRISSILLIKIIINCTETLFKEC